MALTDQPYLPLFVDDWMNNNKLKVCSPASHGVMIAIMCIMHKEPEYGKILLKQKFKQNSKQIKNFALQIAKQTSFDLLDIEPALDELIGECVITIEGDYLVSLRMVKDANTSAKRAIAGKVGGINSKKKPTDFAKDFAQPKEQANAGIEIEDENVLVNTSEIIINQFPTFENFEGVLTESDIKKAIEVYKIRKYILLTSDQVQDMFKAFKIQNLTGKKFYQTDDDVISHFKNWLPTQRIEVVKTEPASNHAELFKALIKNRKAEA